MRAELVFDARNAIGESPVWLASQQALYWVDIPARRLYEWDSATRHVRHWTAPEMIGSIAAHASGGWICAMETGVFHLHADSDGALRGPRVAAVDHARPKMRFNDGRCDRQGRFRAGTMLMDMGAAQDVGRVYALEDDGTLRPLVDGLIVSNGMAFSPDGRTMYLSDSHPQVQCIWAYDYDTDTGTPSNRRLFVDMKPLPGRPDGAAVDEDGCYWICANDAGLVHRFTPAGKLDSSLELPVKKPAMCAFGGAQLDTLYVTSIRPEGIAVSDQPLAGGVFALSPGAKGLPEPAFVQHSTTERKT
ncbi:MAG TPA: SMP-30/gluconolactonase/LRE family protein [Ramlibacter sp.]|nr:SMP-30/gluconolactonase/LRE family protein [Ramlibacter sp.]